jgi:hypothetical protein
MQMLLLSICIVLVLNMFVFIYHTMRDVYSGDLESSSGYLLFAFINGGAAIFLAAQQV